MILDAATMTHAKIFLDSLVIPKDYVYYEIIDLSKLPTLITQPEKISTSTINLPLRKIYIQNYFFLNFFYYSKWSIYY